MTALVTVSAALVDQLLLLTGKTTLRDAVFYLQGRRTQEEAGLGLVLEPVVVTTVTPELAQVQRNRYYPEARPDLTQEQRTMEATFRDAQGEVRRIGASRKIYTGDLRRCREPDKLRLNADNQLRNQLTEQAVRIRYGA